MKEVDPWLYFNVDPELDRIRPAPGVVRELPPLRPEDKERLERRLVERLKAERSRMRELSEPSGRGEPSVAPSAPISVDMRECRVFDRGVGGILTVRSPQLCERIAEPPPARPPEPPLKAKPLDPRPAMPPAPEALAITSPAPEVPPEMRERMGRLPFSPRAPGEELARTAKVPVLDVRKGQTAALGDDFIEKEVPALPFPGSAVGEAVVPIPSLSLEQYAALLAELSMQPGRSDEIRRRYNVMNEAAQRALNKHWEAQIVASPAMFGRYNQALASHVAWVRSQRG